MNNDVTLAQNAAAGNSRDREKVTRLAYRLAKKKTERLCKQYCLENRTLYKCTLDNKWGNKSSDAPLCEWGNGSIAWMLDDLTNNKRLNKFEGRKNAALINYFSKIVNSFQFKERWKDWRRKRRIRVPEYIKALDNDAGKVFWKLCDQNSAPNIAQMLGRDPKEIDHIVRQIYTELHARKKMYTLNFPQEVSLTIPGPVDDQHTQFDLPSMEISSEDQLYQNQLKASFYQLSWKEQFILEAMVIDELDVKSVLVALIEQDISVKHGVPAKQTTANQVYYYRNKSLAKLKRLFELNGDATAG